MGGGGGGGRFGPGAHQCHDALVLLRRPGPWLTCHRRGRAARLRRRCRRGRCAGARRSPKRRRRRSRCGGASALAVAFHVTHLGLARLQLAVHSPQPAAAHAYPLVEPLVPAVVVHEQLARGAVASLILQLGRVPRAARVPCFHAAPRLHLGGRCEALARAQLAAARSPQPAAARAHPLVVPRLPAVVVHEQLARGALAALVHHLGLVPRAGLVERLHLAADREQYLRWKLGLRRDVRSRSLGGCTRARCRWRTHAGVATQRLRRNGRARKLEG